MLPRAPLCAPRGYCLNDLPLQPTQLLGREEHLAALCTLLRRDDVRLVTPLPLPEPGRRTLAERVSSPAEVGCHEGWTAPGCNRPLACWPAAHHDILTLTAIPLGNVINCVLPDGSPRPPGAQRKPASRGGTPCGEALVRWLSG